MSKLCSFLPVIHDVTTFSGLSKAEISKHFSDSKRLFTPVFFRESRYLIIEFI